MSDFMSRITRTIIFVLVFTTAGVGALFAQDGQISLNWNDNTEPDFSHYNVYRSTSSGGPFTKINASDVVVSNYIDTGLTYGTAYYYVVTAVDSNDNESDYSTEDSTSPVDSAAPTDPSNLALSVVTLNRIDLSWTGSTDNLAVTGYRIFRGGTAVTTTTATTYQDTGLTANTAYTYRVLAFDAAGNDSGQSAPASATASDLVAHWNFDEGSGLTAADSSQHAADQEATLEGNPTWTSGRVNGALQFDGIDDYASCENSDYLNQLSDTFTISLWMRNLTTATQYVLDKGGSATGFYLRLNADNTLRFTLNDGATNYSKQSDAAVNPDGSWRHVVITVNGRSAVGLFIDGAAQTTDLDGPLSSVGSVANTLNMNVGANQSDLEFFNGQLDEVKIYNRVLDPGEIASLYEPNQPTGLAAAEDDQEVTLDWDDNPESNLAGYNLYRSLTSGGSYTQVNPTTLTEPTYQDAGLTNGTTYYYRVRAFDAASQGSVDSAEVQATPVDTTAPGAPAGVLATAGDEQITLDWNDNTEPDLASYDVYRSLTPGGPYARINASALTASDYTDTGLTNGTAYYYRVRAVDAEANESADSTEVNATPLDTTAPAPPAGMLATAGDGQVTVNWTANTDPDLSHYNVYRATSAGGPFTTKVNTTDVTATTFVDTTVTNGTTYYYAVKAEDSAGNESSQSAVSAPMTPSDTTPPTPPTGLTVEAL